MNESERLKRILQDSDPATYAFEKLDDKLCERIRALLNDADIDKYCMVDAYYYDFSVIPQGVQEEFNLWTDCYLIFGITTEGEMITKWVDRYDLDSDHPIINGKVIRNDKKMETDSVIPQITQYFDAKLLSIPTFHDIAPMDLCEECRSKAPSKLINQRVKILERED